jgi:hypothetical protein
MRAEEANGGSEQGENDGLENGLIKKSPPRPGRGGLGVLL